MLSNFNKKYLTIMAAIMTFFISAPCFAINTQKGTFENEGLTALTCFGIRWEIVIFALTLVAVAIFYKRTTDAAIIGTAILVIFKLVAAPDFTLMTLKSPQYITTYLDLINLTGMLLGFGILADNFAKSNLPSKIPLFLPNNVFGAVSLLGIVFVTSSFLDNIASAMIGCTIAYTLFNKKLHIGYVVAIVAASNAGGCGSVVGDTTTTLIWLAGHPATDVVLAYIPAIIAMLVLAFVASKQQVNYSPISIPENAGSIKINWVKVFLVFSILALCIASNAILSFPAFGIWLAIYIGKFYTDIDWKLTPESFSSTIFLLVLVFSANLIPLGDMPSPTDMSTFVIGLISGVFNNIPLTQLCLEQNGYHWGLLSFAVGFGGSMVWFGSSAGVAVCDIVPKARSMYNWIKYGWHTIFAYFVAFWSSVLLMTLCS